VYDVIVVGARCAGAPLAMLLARRGYRVLLVDRATFPSDTLSTHLIQTPGVARLKRWGLLERVQATNAPPIQRVHFDQGGDLVLDGQYPLIDGASTTYCVRRTSLDALLVEAAGEAGAEVRQGFAVEEVLTDDGRVIGIRGRDAPGRTVTDRARMVVGADGHRSRVAEAVGASTYHAKPALSCAYYAYFGDVPVTGLEIYGRERRSIGLAPTNDGLTCVYTAWPRAEYPAYRADIERGFFETADLIPRLGELIRAGRRAERFYGTGDLPNVFRGPHGPGWALVGDAGYVVDPLTGQGISDAFRDAELLAEAIDEAFSGRQAATAALATYQTRRDAAALPMYELTTQLASFAPPAPEHLAVLAALRGNQTWTDRFFGVLTGSIPVPEFFSPLNLIQMLGPVGFARVLVSRAQWSVSALSFAPRHGRGDQHQQHDEEVSASPSETPSAR
jgi:flavin-dependent dehydrogenase